VLLGSDVTTDVCYGYSASGIIVIQPKSTPVRAGFVSGIFMPLFYGPAGCFLWAVVGLTRAVKGDFKV
jgi:hypothetical protein